MSSLGGSVLSLGGWAVGERVVVLAFFLGTPMALAGLVFATILASGVASRPSIKYRDGQREYKVAVPSFAILRLPRRASLHPVVAENTSQLRPFPLDESPDSVLQEAIVYLAQGRLFEEPRELGDVMENMRVYLGSQYPGAAVADCVQHELVTSMFKKPPDGVEVDWSESAESDECSLLYTITWDTKNATKKKTRYSSAQAKDGARGASVFR